MRKSGYEDNGEKIEEAEQERNELHRGGTKNEVAGETKPVTELM